MKIPCIKCNKSIWNYVEPYLKEWGYKEEFLFTSNNFCDFPLLVINAREKLGEYNNFRITYSNYYNRELVDDVEEFLERAAKLKGFTYNKSTENKFILHGIELKAGMGLYINSYGASDLYVIFPIKDSLAVILYGNSFSWQKLSNFIDNCKEKIVAISDITANSILCDNIIWKKSNTIITKQEIANKFGVNLSELEII